MPQKGGGIPYTYFRRNEKAKPITQSGRKEFSGPAMGFLPEGGNYINLWWFGQGGSV
jgi:hypothetical protein